MVAAVVTSSRPNPRYNRPADAMIALVWAYDSWCVYNLVIADCCGAQRGMSFCRITPAEGRVSERCSGLERVRVQLSPRPPTPSSRSPYPPVSSSCPSLTTAPVGAAGREPDWTWTTARRRHQGPRAGGDPARGAAPEAGPGSPAPRLARLRSPESH